MPKEKKMIDVNCKHCGQYLCSARPDTKTYCPDCNKWINDGCCKDKKAVKV